MPQKVVLARSVKVGDRIWRQSVNGYVEVLAVRFDVNENAYRKQDRERIVVTYEGELRYAPNMPVVVDRSKEVEG